MVLHALAVKLTSPRSQTHSLKFNSLEARIEVMSGEMLVFMKGMIQFDLSFEEPESWRKHPDRTEFIKTPKP